MTSVSYCISVCDEEKDIKEIIENLEKNISIADEINVTIDTSKNNKNIIDFLNKKEKINKFYFKFEKNFSDLKNFKIINAKKDYIFDLDADERIPVTIFDNMQKILQFKSEVYFLPRINTVPDLDEYHAKLFNYNPDHRGYINFPDYQGRLFMNNKIIRWSGEMHEHLIGFTRSKFLLQDERFAIIHNKSLKKEINSHYTIFNKKEDKSNVK